MKKTIIIFWLLAFTTIRAGEINAENNVEKRPIFFKVTDGKGNVFILKEPIIKIQPYYIDGESELKHGFSWEFLYLPDNQEMELKHQCWVFNKLLFEKISYLPFIANGIDLSLREVFLKKSSNVPSPSPNTTSPPAQPK